MKKRFLVLGMIICMLGLTACGKQEEEQNLMSAGDAQQFAEGIVMTIDQVVSQGMENDYIDMLEQNGMETAVLANAFESWKNASKDMGNYVEIIEIASNSMTSKVYEGTTYAVEGVMSVKVKGSERNAIVEIIYKDRQPTSITTNVEYTFGEKMEKAALNTLLGMGTVFVVLILISFIIASFKYIAIVQDKLSKKPAEDMKKAAVDNTIAQIIENEELEDDLELVAVISAAIAASEGTSTDGFVVRSIRRAGNKWQRA